MTDRSSTKLAIWPFLLCDIIFLGLACLIFSVGHRPLTFWEAVILAFCVGVGAWSFMIPFLRRNAAANDKVWRRQNDPRHCNASRVVTSEYRGAA